MTKSKFPNQMDDAPAQMYGEGQSFQNKIKSTRLETIITADDQINVGEPSSPYHTEYPYNRVDQSFSGHLREVDDTPGAERLMEMHKSGTFWEIHPDGTKVLKIFGEDYYIALKDHTLFVGGNLNITVNGNANVLVAGNAKTKIAGDHDVTVHGNMSTRVSGNYTVFAEGTLQHESKTKLVSKSGGNAHYWAKNRTWIDSKKRLDIDLTGPIPKTNDPGAGLEVSGSLTFPSIDVLFINKTDNDSLIQLRNMDLTYPDDRKPK